MSTLIKNALDANWRVIWHGAGRVGAQQGRRKKMSLEEIGTSHTLATCPERMQRKQRHGPLSNIQEAEMNTLSAE